MSETQTTQKTPKRRSWIWKLALGLAVAIAVVVVLARLLIGGAPGRSLVERVLADNSFAGQTIEMDGFDGDILSSARIGELRISDAEGVWLTARDVEFAWSPAALLGGALKISHIGAGTLHVARQPVIESSPEPKDDQDGGFLQQISLEELAFPDIEIDALAQQPDLRFSLFAGADLGGDGGRLAADLKSLDAAGEDRAEIDLSWTGALIAVGVADIHAPRDGVIQALAPIKARGDLDLDFEGRTDAGQWSATGRLSDDGAEVLRVSGEADNEQINAHIDIQAARTPILAPIAARLGDALQADINVDAGRPREADVRIDLRAQTLTATLEGPINLEARRPAGPISVAARSGDIGALSRVEGLSAALLSVDGEITQTRNAYRFTGDVAADKLAFADAFAADKLAARMDARYAEDKLAAEIDLNAAGPATSSDQTNALFGEALKLSTELSASLEDMSVRIDRLDARGAAVHLTAKGDVAAQGPFKLSGDLELSELARLYPDVDGAAAMAWRAARRKNGKLSLSAKGGADALAWADPELARIFGPSATLNADLRRAPSGAMEFSLDAGAGGLSLTGAGGLVDNALDARLQAALDGELTRSSAALKNAALSATARGSLDALAIEAEAELDAAQAGGVTIEDAKLGFDGLVSGASVTGAASLQARADGEPLTASTRIDTSDGISVSDLRAQWAELTLTGGASRAQDGVMRADMLLEGPLPVEGLAGDMRVKARATGEQFSLDGRISNFETAELVLPETRFTASGTPTAASFSAQTEGRHAPGWKDAPLDLKIEGVFTTNETARRLEMTLSGAYDSEPIRTRTPITATMDDAQTALEGALELLGGQAELFARRSGDNAIEATLEADGIDVMRAATLAGRQDVKGVAAASLRWRADETGADGRVQLRLNDLERAADGSPKVDMTLNANTSGEQWLADLDLSGEGGLSVTGEARAPLRVANGLPRLDPQTDIVSYDVSGAGQLGALWTLVGIETVELDGDFELTANDEATIATTRPTGRIRFENGEFEHAGVGLRLKDIALAARFDDQALSLESVSATGVDGGGVSGRGDLYFDPTRASSLTLDLDRLKAVERNGQELEISGRAEVEKAEKGATITGDLTATRALLDITSLSAGQQIQTVKVRFPDEEEEKIEDDAPAERAFPVLIDLRVSAPNQAYIQGAGLDVEMSADVRVKGRLSDIALIGRAQVVRGGFDLAGQRFDFSEGMLDFNGKARNALLNFRASRRSDGVTSTLQIVGTASKPELVLSSTPALPEDEILSRLLFGRAAAELSTLEAAQLAAAIASMTGNGGLNPLNEIRNIIGLDRLTLSADENGGTSVGAGKYLADDVYLEFRTSPGSVADVAVEWTPRDNIEIGTEFQQDGDARVTVQWKKDYGNGDEDE